MNSPLGNPAAAFSEASLESADMDDPRWVDRARTDSQAFARLYESCYGRILNYAYRRTLDVAAAEELTSATFLKALSGLASYRGTGSFLAWLYGIASNEVRMHHRAERRRREGGPHWQEELRRVSFAARESEALEEVEAKLHRFARVQTALARLPQRYQTVLVLRYFEGLRHEQIAEAISKRPGTVKSLISRGLERLRRCLGDQHGLLPGRELPDTKGGDGS